MRCPNCSSGATVNDTLYFTSGNYTFDDGQPRHNSSFLYALPLNTTLDVSGPIPLTEFNLSLLPSTELTGGQNQGGGGAAGTFFYDHTTLYAYGGLVGDGANETANDRLWTYNIANQTWGLSTVEGGQLGFGHGTDGSFASDPTHSLSFYTGGYVIAFNGTNNGTLRLNTTYSSSPQWSFLTAVNSMPGPNILQGAMVYVRKGQAGILVAFGGYNTAQNGTYFARGDQGWNWDQFPLSEIFVYDIYSNTW